MILLTVNGATELRFNLGLVQDIAAERGQFENQDYWSARKGGLTEVCVATADGVAAYLQSGSKNKYSDLVSCIFVCKMHAGQLFLCLSLWNG